MTQPTAKQYHAALKGVIKRAIIVMDATGDRESRFLHVGQFWDRAVGDADLAYGYNTASVRIVPTSREIAQAEVVSEWLSWLGSKDDPRAVRLLADWAHDWPIWRLAEIEECSERTIHSRIDRAIGMILKEFGHVDAEIEEINEPATRSPPIFTFDKPRVIDEDTPLTDRRRKVWIDGVGYMLGKKKLNNGQGRITDRMLNAH